MKALLEQYNEAELERYRRGWNYIEIDIYGGRIKPVIQDAVANLIRVIKLGNNTHLEQMGRGMILVTISAMMRKLSKLITVIIFTVGVLGTARPAFAIYFGYTNWYDAEKTWNGQDENMCWAAAASNILAWGGWGTSQYYNEDRIFENFQDHWTNQGSLMHAGWQWWFNGEYPPGYPYGDEWSRVDVAGGGNHWPGYNFSHYYHDNWEKADAMSKIAEYIHAGYGTTLAVYGPGGHALTVWGYEYTGGDYQGIYVTDSDDNQSRLAYYPVSFSESVWNLGGDYSGWYIGGVQAFSVHPEPVSSVLFISGAALLVIFRRRRGRRCTQTRRRFT